MRVHMLCSTHNKGLNWTVVKAVFGFVSFWESFWYFEMDNNLPGPSSIKQPKIELKDQNNFTEGEMADYLNYIIISIVNIWAMLISRTKWWITTLRKTLLWYKNLGVHVFQHLLQNSFVLYSHISGKQLQTINKRKTCLMCLNDNRNPKLPNTSQLKLKYQKDRIEDSENNVVYVLKTN